MKALILFLIVGMIAATPVYLLDVVVMPELESLQQTYSQAGDISDRVAAGSIAN